MTIRIAIEFNALQEAEDEETVEELSDDNAEEGTDNEDGSANDDDREDDEETLSEEGSYQGFASLHQDVL